MRKKRKGEEDINIKSLVMNKSCMLVVLGFFIVSSAYAATVSIVQESTHGAGDLNTNLLGTIQSFSTSGTLADFYDYRASEFINTAAVSLTRDQSYLFLVDASDGLGLFVVHDNGGSKGGRAETLVDLLGGKAATQFTCR